MLSRTDFIEPCLPSSAEQPPSGPGWIHEIKHDGYRLMARRDPISIRLLTRNGHDWALRYPLIVEAVNRLKARSCLIDGLRRSRSNTHRKREIIGLRNERDFPHVVELALPPEGFRSEPRQPMSGSTGRRNTGVKFLCRGFKSQGLAWPLIELAGYVEMGLRVHRQVGYLAQASLCVRFPTLRPGIWLRLKTRRRSRYSAIGTQFDLIR